ncbi:MAG: rhomboid family intramembrane serine protease [Paracoccaceae bacterium]
MESQTHKPFPSMTPTVRAWLRRHALTVGVIVILICIECLLTGADLGLWGDRRWRAWAFVQFSFRPIMWEMGWEFWPGQRIGMLLTHIFVHVGFFHMAGNVLSLALLLRLLGWLRSWAFLGVGLVAALGGAFAFWAFTPVAASMTGASGAISGLAAFWIVRRLRQNPVRWKAIAAGLVLFTVLVALEALPGIATAWQAHLGGAVPGAAISVLYKRRPRRSAPDSQRR